MTKIADLATVLEDVNGRFAPRSQKKDLISYGDIGFSPEDREAWAYPYQDRQGNGALQVGRSGAVLPDTGGLDPYTIPFVTTLLQEDRDGDIVVPMGAYLENYERNPVWFFGHRQWEIPIGTSKSLAGKLMVYPEEFRIKSNCRFDPADSDAMLIYNKVKDGFLNATSMAFVPIETYRREQELTPSSHSINPYSVHDLGKARSSQQPVTPPGWIFKRYDVTEISIVGVPSNAGAIRDILDREKAWMSPRLQKGFGAYAAVAKGSWNGWCPNGNCSVPSPEEKQLSRRRLAMGDHPDDVKEDEKTELGSVKVEPYGPYFRVESHYGVGPTFQTRGEAEAHANQMRNIVKSPSSPQEKRLADQYNARGERDWGDSFREDADSVRVVHDGQAWRVRTRDGEDDEEYATQNQANHAANRLRQRLKSPSQEVTKAFDLRVVRELISTGSWNPLEDYLAECAEENWGGKPMRPDAARRYARAHVRTIRNIAEEEGPKDRLRNGMIQTEINELRRDLQRKSFSQETRKEGKCGCDDCSEGKKCPCEGKSARKMANQADMEVPGSRPPLGKNNFDGEEDPAAEYRNSNASIQRSLTFDSVAALRRRAKMFVRRGFTVERKGRLGLIIKRPGETYNVGDRVLVPGEANDNGKLRNPHHRRQGTVTAVHGNTVWVQLDGQTNRIPVRMVADGLMKIKSLPSGNLVRLEVAPGSIPKTIHRLRAAGYDPVRKGRTTIEYRDKSLNSSSGTSGGYLVPPGEMEEEEETP